MLGNILRMYMNLSSVGPQCFLDIWGEMLLISRELGSTDNNVRGAGEQAQSFGDLDNPANKSKKKIISI